MAMAESRLSHRALRALDETDAMVGELRECVHDYGLPIVQACLQAGVREARHIRHIVGACWANAVGQPNGRRGMAASIDALLLRNGGVTTADQLAALLRAQGAAMLPVAVDSRMVRASMQHGTLRTEREHLLGIGAALRAAAEDHWPRHWL